MWLNYKKASVGSSNGVTAALIMASSISGNAATPTKTLILLGLIELLKF